jgi:hypothetical protein
MTFKELKTGDKFRDSAGNTMMRMDDMEDKWGNVWNAIITDGPYQGTYHSVYPESLVLPLRSYDNDINLHSKINYAICNAIDMTKLGIILDSMCKDGIIGTTEARSYQRMASAILSVIRQANDRKFNKGLSSAI